MTSTTLAFATMQSDAILSDEPHNEMPAVAFNSTQSVAKKFTHDHFGQCDKQWKEPGTNVCPSS